MLTGFGEDVWEANQPLRVMGMDIGHRMTVTRLDSGELVIHSPVAWSGDLQSKLAGLGPVRWIVAPTTMHDLYLQDWMAHYPEATLLHAPGMKIPGVKSDRMGSLDQAIPATWTTELEVIPLRGMPKINEFAILHRPSRTLIVADLVFNLPPGNGMQKWLQKMNGIYEKLGVSRFYKTYISDQAEFKASVETILARDFDSMTVSHGNSVRAGAGDHLAAALRPYS